MKIYSSRLQKQITHSVKGQNMAYGHQTCIYLMKNAVQSIKLFEIIDFYFNIF